EGCHLMVVEGSHRHAAQLQCNCLQQNVLGGMSDLEQTVPRCAIAVPRCHEGHIHREDEAGRRIPDAGLAEGGGLQLPTQVGFEMPSQAVIAGEILEHSLRRCQKQSEGIAGAGGGGGAEALWITDPLPRPTELRKLLNGQLARRELAAGSPSRQHVGQRPSAGRLRRRECELLIDGGERRCHASYGCGCRSPPRPAEPVDVQCATGDPCSSSSSTWSSSTWSMLS